MMKPVLSFLVRNAKPILGIVIAATRSSLKRSKPVDVALDVLEAAQAQSFDVSDVAEEAAEDVIADVAKTVAVDAAKDAVTKAATKKLGSVLSKIKL